MFVPKRTSLGSFQALNIQAQMEKRAPAQLILLPGINVVPEDFVTYGLIDAIAAQGHEIDIAAIALTSTDYLEDDFTQRLHEEVVLHAQRQGYRHIALLGLSLGAMGALHYMRCEGALIDELILLAPFLGTPGTIAEVARAGGLRAWSPGPLPPGELERTNLCWLKSHLENKSARPCLRLGFGREDRFAGAMSEVAEYLPNDRVTILPGAHDWPTWRNVWKAMLAKPIFQSRP